MSVAALTCDIMQEYRPKVSENDMLSEKLRCICDQGFTLNITSLLQYANNVKEVLINPIFVAEDERRSNMNVVEECLRFVYTNYNPDVPEVSTGKRSVLYEILFLLTSLQQKLICHENPIDQQVVFQMGCAIAGIVGKGALIWIKTKEFGKADLYINSTLRMLNKDGSGEPVELVLFRHDKLNYESKWVSLLLYKIHIYTEQGQLNKVLEVINRMKARLVELPAYQNVFSNLCFNASLTARKNNDHEIAISLLRLSFDYRKKCNADPQKLQVVLKLLADSYLKFNRSNNWEKSIHALELAYYGKVDSYFLINKLKATIVSNEKHLIKEVLNTAVHWDEIDVATVLNMTCILISNGKEELVLQFIADIKNNVDCSFGIEKLLPVELKLCLLEGDIEKAKRVCDYYLRLLDDKNNLSLNVIGQMINVILPQALNNFSSSQYSQSIMWHQLCFDILEKTLGVEEYDLGDIMCFVQRQICHCNIMLNNLEDAEVSLSHLKLMKDDSLMASYLSLKIAILTDNEALASEALLYLGTTIRKAGSDQEQDKEDFEAINPVSAILLCCKDAYNMGKKAFVMKIFETYISVPISKCDKYLFIQIFQCLVRTYLEYIGEDSEVYERILMHMDKVLLVLKSIQEEVSKTEEDKNNFVSEMAEWLDKICWNLATYNDATPNIRFHLLSYCVSLLEVSNSITCDPAALVRLKTCLLLGISTGLHVARSEDDLYSKSDIIKKVLILIEKCRNLNLEPIRHTAAGKMPTGTLFMHEFEANTLNESPYLQDLFDKALDVPELNANSFETMAALSHETGLVNYAVTVKALKVAVMKHLENPEPDFTQISKDYHSLLEVLFSAQEHIDPNLCQDIYACCEEIIEFIQFKAGGNFPEIETFWIMVKCWNTGIHNYIRENNEQAFRWCTLAFSLLKELNALKCIHGDKITELYKNLFPTEVCSMES